MVLIIFFHAAVWRDSVSLLRFPFLSHAQGYSYEILPIGSLKYPYSCFSSHFFFLVVVQLMIMLFVLFLVLVVTLSLLLTLSSSPRMDASALSSTMASPIIIIIITCQFFTPALNGVWVTASLSKTTEYSGWS